MSRHGCGDTRRVTRVRRTIGADIRVRIATVHVTHPNVGRDRVTTTIARITVHNKNGLSFPIVTAVGNRALRGRYRDGILRRNRLFLLSTNTRGTVRCTNSLASAVPIDKHFARRRHAIFSVGRHTCATTIGTLHPNITFHSMRLATVARVYHNVGRLNLVGNSSTRTTGVNTCTLFVPYNLKRVVNLSMRSVRGLNRICINCGNRPGDARFNFGSLHLTHPLRPNFIFAIRPNVCFVPRLVSG